MSALSAISSASDFQTDVLESPVPVLVDFWAEWCRPCLALTPHFEAAASKFEGRVKFVKVDVDSNPEVSARYGIMSIPAMLLIRNGQEVDRMVGLATEPEISAFLQRNL